MHNWVNAFGKWFRMQLEDAFPPLRALISNRRARQNVLSQIAGAIVFMCCAVLWVMVYVATVTGGPVLAATGIAVFGTLVSIAGYAFCAYRIADRRRER